MWTKRLRWAVRMSRCRCPAVDESTGEADPAPWTRKALKWVVVQWWMSSLLVSRGGGRGRCGRRSRSGEVDAAGSEWALVRCWMSSLGFREGRGERAMKYGRRDVRCSGAVELVVFAGRGEEMGVPWSGGTGSYQSSPDLSCR